MYGSLFYSMYHTGETFFIALPCNLSENSEIFMYNICVYSIQVLESASIILWLGNRNVNSEDLTGHDTIKSTKNFFFNTCCVFLHVVSLHDCPVHHSAWNNRESSCYSVFNNSEQMQDKTGIINKSWCMYLSYFLFTCKIFVISEIYKCKRELWAFSDSQGYMYLISLTCIRWNIKNYSK